MLIILWFASYGTSILSFPARALNMTKALPLHALPLQPQVKRKEKSQAPIPKHQWPRPITRTLPEMTELCEEIAIVSTRGTQGVLPKCLPNIQPRRVYLTPIPVSFINFAKGCWTSYSNFVLYRVAWPTIIYPC